MGTDRPHVTRYTSQVEFTACSARFANLRAIRDAAAVFAPTSARSGGPIGAPTLGGNTANWNGASTAPAGTAGAGTGSSQAHADGDSTPVQQQLAVTG